MPKGDDNLPCVAERLGVSFIERSLKQGLQFVRHKNNTEEVRAQARRTIAAFLPTQMNNGAFRSREPDKAFFALLSQARPRAIDLSGAVPEYWLSLKSPANVVAVSLDEFLMGTTSFSKSTTARAGASRSFEGTNRTSL